MALDIYAYWQHEPPEPSPRLALWLMRIQSGWKPNARIKGMSYSERAKFFGVYLWEYLNILYPLIKDL